MQHMGQTCEAVPLSLQSQPETQLAIGGLGCSLQPSHSPGPAKACSLCAVHRSRVG